MGASRYWCLKVVDEVAGKVAAREDFVETFVDLESNVVRRVLLQSLVRRAVVEVVKAESL